MWRSQDGAWAPARPSAKVVAAKPLCKGQVCSGGVTLIDSVRSSEYEGRTILIGL